jgi:glycosyltransferase involved in cell wall biosynthesis
MDMDKQNSTRPWVSFCMTTRRRPDFLIKTLRSIQRQTVANFEVIVSDNDVAGSGRPVVEGLKDSRFHYYCNEADLGMNASFNRSLAKAKGDFVVMITDDDPVYPEMLEILKGLSEKYPGLGAYSGGCDVVQTNPTLAKFTLHRVGNNSCLAPIPLGTVRTFSAETFPHAFFGGELEMYLFMSVGMVRREIAQSVGGMPDYGSPYLGDFAFTAATFSRAGCAIINQAVGVQTVHDFNFGRKECGEMKTAALGFTECMTKEFSNRPDWPRLKAKVEKFVGQWMVLHSLFLKQYFTEYKKNGDESLRAILNELFEIPYVRRFRRYYYFGSLFMRLQRIQADLRNNALKRMRSR